MARNFPYSYRECLVRQESLANAPSSFIPNPYCPPRPLCPPPCPPPCPPYPPCPTPCPPYPPCPPPPGPYKAFRSAYFEALGGSQTVVSGNHVVFDAQSFDSVGAAVTLDDTGTVFTINRPGLYLVEWNVNVAQNGLAQPIVLGIVENGSGASGASSSTGGNFASGTLINVASVPFTVSLHNYADDITLENHSQYENSAVSIRIVRFADGAMG